MLAPADDDTPLPAYVVLGRPGRPGALQRLRRPAELRSADRRPGRPLDRARAGSTSCTCTSRSTPSVSLLALWAAEGPVVATFHTSNLRSRAMQAAYPLLRPGPGEDQRPHRRLRGRPAHRHHPPRRRRGRHPQRRLRRPVRLARCPRAQWLGTPQAPTIAFLGRIDEPRKGLPVLVRRAAAGAGGAARACACWSPAPATRTTARSRMAARGGRRLRVPRRRSATRTRPRCWPRSTSTSRRTPAARASASCWSRR